MTDYELNFSLKIEEMLSGIADPAYRCLVVEVSEQLCRPCAIPDV